MKHLTSLLLACFIIIYPMNGGAQKTSDIRDQIEGAGVEAAVELDVFSGRGNPTWRLPKRQAQALVSMLKGLQPAQPSEFFDGLGYRGFNVSLSVKTGTSEEDQEIRIYKGKVRWGDEDDAAAKFYSDPGLRIEWWLLERGKAHLQPSVYEHVKEQLASP